MAGLGEVREHHVLAQEDEHDDRDGLRDGTTYPWVSEPRSSRLQGGRTTLDARVRSPLVSWTLLPGRHLVIFSDEDPHG